MRNVDVIIPIYEENALSKEKYPSFFACLAGYFLPVQTFRMC